MAELGWTPYEVADCPMPDVWSIYRHWRKHPPVSWLAAAYLKYTPPDENPRAPAEMPSQFQQMAAPREGVKSFSSLPPQVQEALRKKPRARKR